MAYQIGVLTCIVVAAVIALSSTAIALWGNELEIVAGMLVLFVAIFWFWRVPDGFLRRIHLLFRDGVPLAPYGFRKNATLGYWLGIPIIYVGHVIAAVTLYLFWELSKRHTEGVPLGIAAGFAITAYGLGIGLVESSYRLWARRLNGAIPGDPGSSPQKPVVWSILVGSTLIFLLYVTDHSARPVQGANNTLGTQTSQDRSETQSTPTAIVELIDFIAATDGEWSGDAIYRVDKSSQVIRMPAILQGSLAGGDTVQLMIGFPNSSRESENIQYQLSAEGDRLNNLAVIERTELADGRLRIVAYGEEPDFLLPDATAAAVVRATFILGNTSFQLKRHIEQEAGHFLLRDEYNFVRPARSE